MWADVCVSAQEPAAAARTLMVLEKLGYSTMCWCSESTGRLEGLRAPIRPAGVTSMRQLARLNVHVEEEQHVAHIHTSRDILHTYDLVAVVPHSEAALERCLQTPAVEHIDIISLPSAQRSPFTLKPALLKRAVKAGLHFELCYSAALRDGLSRRHFVSNLQVRPASSDLQPHAPGPAQPHPVQPHPTPPGPTQPSVIPSSPAPPFPALHHPAPPCPHPAPTLPHPAPPCQPPPSLALTVLPYGWPTCLSGMGVRHGGVCSSYYRAPSSEGV